MSDPTPLQVDPRPTPAPAAQPAGHLARASNPKILHWCATAASVAIIGLIGSGGWVRLSGSGLGCPTWPNCTAHQLVAPDRYHALVEFVNRGFITAVGVLIGVTVLAALVQRPRRRDVVWLAAGLVIGYIGEAVLGGITVLLKLAPALVASHLILAMGLLIDALVLQRRSRPGGGDVEVVDRSVVWLSTLLIVVMLVGVAVGTVVTGSGPHSGSPGTPRFDLPFASVAELHAVIGMFLFGLTVALWFVLRTAGVGRATWRRYGTVLGLMALQGCLGYATYFTKVQVDLAESHIVGGALLLAALVLLRLGLRAPSKPPVEPAASTAAAADAQPAALSS